MDQDELFSSYKFPLLIINGVKMAKSNREA